MMSCDERGSNISDKWGVSDLMTPSVSDEGHAFSQLDRNANALLRYTAPLFNSLFA
jgi:hypothetical protein